MKNICLLSFISFNLLILSCVSLFNHNDYVSRGSLSEAMEKSSDDYENERKVEDSRRYYEPSYNNYDDDYDDDEEYISIKERRRARKQRADVYVSPPAKSMILINKDSISQIDSSNELSGDTNQLMLKHMDMEQYTDSSGKIDLEEFRVKLLLPFVLDKKVDKIVISSSDLNGRSKEYLIQKSITIKDENANEDITIKNDSVKSEEVPIEDEEWTIKERMKEHYIGFRFLTGLKYSSKYSNITGGSLTWAYHYDEKRRAAIHFGASYLPSREDSDLLGSIDDLWELHLGYEHRFYLTPDRSFLGAFVPLEATLRTMFWKYRNPITTDVYDDDGNFISNEEITGDGLWGLSLGAGVGFSLIQTNVIKLSGLATVGGTLYWFETHEGFDNDVFVGDLYLRFSIEMLFGVN